MIFLDLFAGIGGFALAAYNAGLKFDMHLFSEINREVIRIYQSRFPDAQNLGDIRNIRKEDLPDGEYVICGGFPCQDISIAGRGAGLGGTKSQLWFEMLRVICLVRPMLAVVENVSALLVRGLDTVLGGLAENGFDAEWQTLSAREVGAPHKRERIWIVAYPHSQRRENATLPLACKRRDSIPGEILRRLEAGERPDTGHRRYGALNPQFVEWLLGLPLNWTDIIIRAGLRFSLLQKEPQD